MGRSAGGILEPNCNYSKAEWISLHFFVILKSRPQNHGLAGAVGLPAAFVAAEGSPEEGF
jgi:hypothetical protein